MLDRSFIIALAALLAAAAGLAGVMIGSASRGSFSPAGSTYRAAPDGARGLFLFAEALGIPVLRRHLNLEMIEEDAGGVIVLLGINGGWRCEVEKPHARKQPPSDSSEDGTAGSSKPARGGVGSLIRTKHRLNSLECQALREWVFEGGRLVHVVGSHDALLASMGIVFTRSKGRDEESASLVPGQPSNLVAGVLTVAAPIAGYLRSTDGDEVVLLATADELRPAAIARRHGLGRIVAISAPALATNRWLGEEDNSVFWAGLLEELRGGEPVAFVEHHHGHKDERSILGYLLGRGLLPAVLQVSLVFLVGTAAVRRLGLPLTPPRERTRAEGDLLSAMSRIYKLGNHAEHAGEVIAARAVDEASRMSVDPVVSASLESLKGARTRLRARSEAGQADEDDLAEVARRAAAVYDAIARRRGRRGAAKASSLGSRSPLKDVAKDGQGK